MDSEIPCALILYDFRSNATADKGSQANVRNL